MTTISDYTERHAFLLALVEATDAHDTVTINIPDDALIANNKEKRRMFETARDGMWRWPAGGVAIILKLADVNILLTIHRDKGAPSYAGHDTLSSGLGSSIREMLYPLETAWREGAEELCIVTPRGIICPIPATDHFGFGLELTEVTRSTANLFPELRNRPVLDITTDFLPLPGEKKVVINFRGKTRQTSGLVVFDPGTNGIDLLKVVAVPVNCTLSDLVLYDGETAGGRSLDRQVNALELDDEFRPTGRLIASWKRGERIFGEVAPMTPVLQAVHTGLKRR